MVVQVGSLAISGIFKAGGLLSGLGTMSAKLKDAGLKGKSTATEMKRMTGHAHLLRNALAAVGVAGFTSLLMQTPQLAGALAKIKSEMTLIAYKIGAHLKPALDAVGTILRGIRTGDWSVVVQGVKDLTVAVVDLVAEASKFVLDLVFGEGTFAGLSEDVSNWWAGVVKEWEEGTFGSLVLSIIVPPMKWIWDKLIAFWAGVRDAAIEAGRAFRRSIDEKGVTSAMDELYGVDKVKQLMGWGEHSGIGDINSRYGAKADEWGWETDRAPTTSIGTQQNTIYVDATNAYGNLDDPTVIDKLYQVFTDALKQDQESGTY